MNIYEYLRDRIEAGDTEGDELPVSLDELEAYIIWLTGASLDEPETREFLKGPVTFRGYELVVR